MASLCNGTLLCNGYVAFEIAISKYFTNKDICFHFLFSHSLMFTNGATIILDDRSVVKDFYANKIAALAARTLLPGNKLQY